MAATRGIEICTSSSLRELADGTPRRRSRSAAEARPTVGPCVHVGQVGRSFDDDGEVGQTPRGRRHLVLGRLPAADHLELNGEDAEHDTDRVGEGVADPWVVESDGDAQQPADVDDGQTLVLERRGVASPPRRGSRSWLMFSKGLPGDGRRA